MNPTIEITGEFFLLTFPGVDAEGTHTVQIPIGATEVLVRILMNWKEAQPKARKIGNEASPTQYMVDAWLNSNEARVDVRAQAARAAERKRSFEERFGINPDEVELEL